MSEATSPPQPQQKKPFSLFIPLLLPILAATIIYQLDNFSPAHLPTHEFTQTLLIPNVNPNLLLGSNKVGQGELLAPEDIVYEAESGVAYTGCVDGWIKRVDSNEVVSEWVNTGGRPLGLALGPTNELIIADADKGLLKVSKDGEIELLTNEAEGIPFKLTDGVDVAKDGIIYFTDASYKYTLREFIWDILEGRPYGRLLSYDPSTKETKVLLSDLYFPNGVSLSPDQNFVIFCETQMRRCQKYYIGGKEKGSVERFVDGLPGFPDNIRYDGEGQYWIAISTEVTFSWDITQRYPLARKVLAIIERYIGRPNMEKNGGVLAVDLNGKPTALYCDPKLSMISTGIKIGDQLFLGSIHYPYIIRLNITQNPALPSI
nr:strictosidine synthase [Lysimachia christinae]